MDIIKDTCAQPGLLQVCRQIRAEASAIYYQENRFYHDVIDLDPDVIINFWKHAKHFLTIHDDRTHLWLTPTRNSWANLLRWLKAFHEDRAMIMNDAKAVDPVCDILAGAFAMVKELKADEWSKVLALLLHYKKATRHVIEWDA